MQEHIVEKLTPSEIVATFPNAKTTVKRLIKECEEFLDEVEQTRADTKSFLSSRVPMYDIDICTEIVIAASYGGAIEENKEKLQRLRRLLFLYEPAKKSKDGISDTDIARAKEFPIKELIKVRMSTALCPFHNEKTPSFHVYPDNHAYCFSCSKRADAIDVAMQLQNLDFIGAVKWLNGL